MQNQLNAAWWQQLLFSALASYEHASIVRQGTVQEFLWGAYCNGTAAVDPFLELVAKLTKQNIPPYIPLQINLTSPENTFALTQPNVQYTGASNVSWIHRASLLSRPIPLGCFFLFPARI